jgi:AcrR family transcriptional regulator
VTRRGSARSRDKSSTVTARKPAKPRSKPAGKNARVEPKRQRRTSEVAQEQILDAAEKRFGTAGAGGLRLKQLAEDIGVSHSTILHHFGSREELVKAVVTRALDGLQQKLVAAFSSEAFGPEDGQAVFRQIMATLGDRGHARSMAWLALEGHSGDPAQMLRALAELMHSRRVEITGRAVPLEDTQFVTLLGALALFAEGVLGDAMFESAGLGKDPAARARFHEWFLKLIDQHLHGPGLLDPP